MLWYGDKTENAARWVETVMSSNLQSLNCFQFSLQRYQILNHQRFPSFSTWRIPINNILIVTYNKRRNTGNHYKIFWIRNVRKLPVQSRVKETTYRQRKHTTSTRIPTLANYTITVFNGLQIIHSMLKFHNSAYSLLEFLWAITGCFNHMTITYSLTTFD